MTIELQDPQILATLNPPTVANYLRQHHWNETHPIADIGSVWQAQPTGEQKFEILLPLKPELDDFPFRMNDVLTTLAEVEQRSPLAILGDLLTIVPNITLQGMVVQIHEIGEAGKVVFMGVVIDKLRRIQTELTAPAYELAIKAYQARIPILCQGDLIRCDRLFILQNPHHFTLDLEAWL
jgi:hypothetical protein